MRLRGRHYRTGDPIDVVVSGPTIASVAPAGPEPADTVAGWIAPALCDVQINGCDNKSFGSPRLTRDDVRHVIGVCQRHGISEICPTLITGAYDDLVHGFTILRRACEEEPDLARAIVGIHLEGPYISPDDGPRGAHPLQHVRPSDWDEFRRFQDAAGGRIRMVTLAPERPGAIAFIEKLVAAGIVVAIGHTAASRSAIRDAVRAGARTSTHLGNGSHAVLPRHDNYLWEQAAADELWASLIVDGHHLPASVVRCLVRAKGLDRLLLTCDAGPLAGMPPGRYRDWETEMEILPQGKIVVAGTPFLAGSWVFTEMCVTKAMEFAGMSLGDAIDLASAQPRRLLGLPPRSLAAGQPADLILFDQEGVSPMRLRMVLVAGVGLA
jgi:N-acetylglucosamine-6-phosphate deacetylase